MNTGTVHSFTVSVAAASEVAALLQTPEFIDEWNRLIDSCPWATSFQGAGFVRAWLQSYGSAAEPLFVLGRTPDGALAGLLTLATMDGELVVAGGRQAEYRVWLSTPGLAEHFPPAALAAVRDRQGTRPLLFEYVPPKTPVQWTTSDPAISSCCELTPLRRPIMTIDAKDAGAALSKRRYRTRLKQLAQIGEVKFERLQGRDQLAQWLPPIAAFYDIRMAAISGDRPFSSDPLKASFHLALADVPGLLHMTVLRIGNEIFAAHLGVRSRDAVHLGLLTHSPFQAKYSLGRLHVMYLGEMLAAQGCTTLDLTAGGDEWKEGFATGHDDVFRLRVFPTRAAAARASRITSSVSLGRRLALAAGVSPSRARETIALLRSRGVMSLPPLVVRRVRRAMYAHAELRAYTLAVPESPPVQLEAPAHRDHLIHLARFQEAPGTPSLRCFYESALGRIASDHHFYTRTEGDLLVHWGWFAERQSETHLDEVNERMTLPEGCGVLYDFYTHPLARRRGYYEATLRQMIQDAALAGVRKLYIFVLADNGASRRVIEKVGFTYQFSFFERKLFGRRTAWNTRPAGETSP